MVGPSGGTEGGRAPVLVAAGRGAGEVFPDFRRSAAAWGREGDWTDPDGQIPAGRSGDRGQHDHGR